MKPGMHGLIGAIVFAVGAWFIARSVAASGSTLPKYVAEAATFSILGWLALAIGAALVAWAIVRNHKQA